MSKAQDLKALREKTNNADNIHREFQIDSDNISVEAYFKGILPLDVIDRSVLQYERNYKMVIEQFKNETALRGYDWAFLFTAVALQALRQYVIGPWLKDKRASAQGKDEPAKMKNNRTPGWYYVQTKQIMTSKVPFDTNKYSGNATIANFLKGHGNHRNATLGHDPALGWVFGTANIMTGTITNTSLLSAHVKYTPSIGNVIHSRADTLKVFESVVNRVFTEKDGLLALASALVREGVHLASDATTKHSLPLPGVEALSPDLANKLAKYKIDAISVGTEATLSALINTMISMVHRMLMPDEEDENLYRVRTRKILLYSNLIASTSNIIYAAITKDLKRLDIGGLIVTLYRIHSDTKFIDKIKYEFINSRLNDIYKEKYDDIAFYYDE